MPAVNDGLNAPLLRVSAERVASEEITGALGDGDGDGDGVDVDDEVGVDEEVGVGDGVGDGEEVGLGEPDGVREGEVFGACTMVTVPETDIPLQEIDRVANVLATIDITQ